MSLLLTEAREQLEGMRRDAQEQFEFYQDMLKRIDKYEEQLAELERSKIDIDAKLN